MQPEELARLIEGCIRGDQRSQKLLYHSFSPRLYAVCLRYMNSREEAQDVLQEGFIKIFSKLSTYQFQGAFEGWMRRIMVNTALEQLRKQKSRFEEPLDDHQVNPAEGNLAEHKMAVDHLMKALQQLALGYRTVFNLYVVEGFSHAEIAEQLGITEATSKSQLSRAKKILQSLISPHE